MRAAAAAPLRSGSRGGSSGTSGAKAVKKLRKGEGAGGRSRSSDNVGAGSGAQPQQDGYSRNTAFCTPSLPCWAAAERDALEQLTDAFFSRHRLHLRVWPVSAGSGAASAETAPAGAPRRPASGGGSSSSRSAGPGGEVTSRRGRAATAAASGREEQSRKEGGRDGGALERKGLAEGGEALRRSGLVGAARGPAAAAVERSGGRRAPLQKSRRAAAVAPETIAMQQAESVREVKREEPAPEEEDEATKVRREQLLNVRAMLYDRVTENVSFTCTEYNTPSKPSRNAKLPSFLRLRGVRASESSTDPVLCGGNAAAGGDPVARRGTAATEDAAGTAGGGSAAGGADNVEAVRQGLKKEDGMTCGGELKHETGSCSEPGAAAHAAATGNVEKREGEATHQEGDGSSLGRWPQQTTSITPGTAGRKTAKAALLKDETASAGRRSSIDGDVHQVSSKQAWSQDAPEDTDACGDPGKLKELQQSLLSDGFTGCWVLLLTEKYVPPTSPTVLSPQHASTHRVAQAPAASSFAPQTQKQRRLSAGQQNAEGPAAAEAVGGEGAPAAPGETGADAVLGERDDSATDQQEVVRQQPRVRRIIVCGALIEVYSNNERQIAALWCLPCLSAHATRLLLQAFLPRVLLEALRIPDVATTQEEEEQQGEKISTLQSLDSSGGKKRKWKQEGGLREAGREGELKQQQRQQRGSNAGGSFQKRMRGEEGQTKQQNGCFLDGGEKGRRRKSSSSAEETESANVPATRRGEARGGTQPCEAVKEEAGQPQQILRPIKSVFAVYEDILLWPRQALFLLASSSRLGFMRHAEPLLGVPADDEEENVAAAVRKKTGIDEKQRGNSAYRKQPYLHVDAGLGPQWRECNCRKRFFSSRPHFVQQRRRRGTSAANSSKGSGPGAATGTGKAGSAEESCSSSSRRGGGGGAAAAATAATSGRLSHASASRGDSCGSREAPPSGDGLLRFFSVSDLWAARLMPPREKRAALQQAEVRAAQLPGLAAAQTKHEGGREGEGRSSSSFTTTSPAGTSTHEKPAEMEQNPTQVKGKSWSSRGEMTKKEDVRYKKAEIHTEAAAEVPGSSAGIDGGQEAVWGSEQQMEKSVTGENADTSSGKFWPQATDGWSCLVPRGTSEQILREIYCDLPVLSETNFEECLAEEVDVSQDEMCGLSESECKELLRWWDK